MDKSQHPISQRIKFLIDELYGGSVRKFCLAIGYGSSQKINRLFSEDKRTGKFPVPTIGIINDISNKLDINKTWLTDGVGNYSAKQDIPDTSQKSIQYIMQENEALKKENNDLLRENRELYRKLLSSKDQALDKSLSPDKNIVDDKL